MNKRKWILLSLILSFILLTVLVKLNLVNAFDSFFYNLITLKINGGITGFYKIITFLGSTKFIVLLSVVLFFVFIILKKKNYSFIIVCSIVISTIINNLLKIIIMRERPDVLKMVHESSYSFPSGHTMAAVTMYGILLYIVLRSNLNTKIKKIFSVILSIIPILVALSRVYLGAHFITDVIGAFIVSIILLLIETYYIDKNNWI